jgi:hypothetical protein
MRTLLALSLLLPAAPPRKPIYHGSPPCYFPVKVGARWVYELNGREDTYVVTAVERKKEETLVSVAILSGDERQPRETWSVSERGLALLCLTPETRFDAPQQELRLPAWPGREWAVKTSGNFIERSESACTLAAVEVVEVPAGKFRACRVETVLLTVEGRPPKTPRRSTRWFAPGVGVVKDVMDDGDVVKTTVLKSFTPAPK